MTEKLDSLTIVMMLFVADDAIYDVKVVVVFYTTSVMVVAES